MTAVKTVMFDLDNTLFDFDAWWEKSLRESIRTSPLTCMLDGDAVYKSFREHGDALWTLYTHNQVDLSEYRRLRLRASLQEFYADVSDLEVTKFSNHFDEIGFRTLHPDHNILQMLHDIKNEFLIGIVTNGTVSHQMEKIKRLGFDDLFSSDAIVISEQIGSKKPELGFFQSTCAQLNIEPSETVVVGDSWETDVIGAANAGMVAIWLNTKGQNPKSKHRAFATIECLKDLRNVLARVSIHP